MSTPSVHPMASGYQIVLLLRRLPILIPFSRLLVSFFVMRPALHQRTVLEVQQRSSQSDYRFALARDMFIPEITFT